MNTAHPFDPPLATTIEKIVVEAAAAVIAATTTLTLPAMTYLDSMVRINAWKAATAVAMA